MKILSSSIPVEPPKEYTLMVNQEELDIIVAAVSSQGVSGMTSELSSYATVSAPPATEI